MKQKTIYSISTYLVVLSFIVVIIIMAMVPYFIFPNLQELIFAKNEKDIVTFITKDDSAPVASIFLIFLGIFAFGSFWYQFVAFFPKIINFLDVKRIGYSPDHKKPFLILTLIVTFTFLPFFLYSFDTYTYFTKEKVCHSVFWGLGKKCYNFSEIDAISLEADNSSPKSRKTYLFFAYNIVIGAHEFRVWDSNDRQYEKINNLHGLIVENNPSLVIDTNEVESSAIKWLKNNPQGTPSYPKEMVINLLDIYTVSSIQ